MKKNKFVFCILKNSKGDLLLQKKTSDYLNGNWVLFGGSVEEGELPEGSMKRELMEELGLNAEPKFLFSGEADSGDWGISDIFVFEGRLELSEIKTINEGAGLAFFSEKELGDINIFSNSRWALDKYLKE